MATQVVVEESSSGFCAKERNFDEPHDRGPENEDASPKEPVEALTLNWVQADNCLAFYDDITNNLIMQDNLKMTSEKEEFKTSPICSISDVALVLEPQLEHLDAEKNSEEMCRIEDSLVDKLHRSLSDGLFGEDLCTGITYVSKELGQRWLTMEDRYQDDVMEKAFRLNMIQDHTCLSHQNPIADLNLQLKGTQQIDDWVQFGCKRDAIRRHSASAIVDKSGIMRGTFLGDDLDERHTDKLLQQGWLNDQCLQHYGRESDFQSFQNLSGRRVKRICDNVKDCNVDMLQNSNLAIREIVLNMQKQIDNLKENFEQVVRDKTSLAEMITYQHGGCSKVDYEKLENGADILTSNGEDCDSVQICIKDDCFSKQQCAKLWQIHSELQLENNKLKSLERSLKEQITEQYRKFALCEKNFQKNFVEIQNELKQVLREKSELEKKASLQAEEVVLLRNRLLGIRQMSGDSNLDMECSIMSGITQNCSTEMESSFGKWLKDESKCDMSGDFSSSNFEEMYLKGLHNESYLKRVSSKVLQMHFFKDRLGNLQEDKDLFVLKLEEQERLMTRMQGQSEATGLMESQAQLSFECQSTASHLPRADLQATEENFKAKQSSIIAVLEQKTTIGKPFQNDLDTVKESQAELMSQKQQVQEMQDALGCETRNFEKGDANKELRYQLEKENKRMEQTEENLQVNRDALHTDLAQKTLRPKVHRSPADEQVQKIQLLENQFTVEHLKVHELQCLLDEGQHVLQKQRQEQPHPVCGLTEHECVVEGQHEEEMQALKAKYELQIAEAKEELERKLMELKEQLDSQRITQIALIKEVHEREREREVAALIERHVMEMQQLRVENQRLLERIINLRCGEQKEVDVMERGQEVQTEMQPKEEFRQMMEVTAESNNLQVNKASLESRIVEKISTLSKDLEESKWVNSTLKERLIRCSEDLQETQKRFTQERKAMQELIVNHQTQKDVHSREMKDLLNLLHGRQQDKHSVQTKDVDFICALQKCQNDMDLMKNELTTRHQEEMELLKYLMTQIHQEEIESMKKTLDVMPQEQQHKSNMAKLKMLLNMDCYVTMETTGAIQARQSFADIQSLRNDHRIAIEECITSHEENLKEMQAIIFSRDKELRAFYDEKAAVFKDKLTTKVHQEIVKLKESCRTDVDMLRKILDDGRRERADEYAKLVHHIKMLLRMIQEDHKVELEDKEQKLEREHQLKRETLLQEIREQQMKQDGALQELQLLYKQQIQQLFQEQEAQHQAKIEALSSQHKREVQVMALASEREFEKLALELNIRLGVVENWPAREQVEEDRHNALQAENGEVQRVTRHTHKEVLLEELSRLQMLQKEEKENLNKAVQAKANQAEQFRAEASRLREMVQQVQLELETVLHRRERENGEGDTLLTMLRADLQNKEMDRQEVVGANQHLLQVLSEVFQQILSSEEVIGQRVVSLLAEERPVHTVIAAEHLGQTASEITSVIAGKLNSSVEVFGNIDTPHEKLEISQHLAESLFVGPVLEPREEKLVLESAQRLHGALQHLLGLLVELTQQVQEARSAHAELLQESTRCTVELSKAMFEQKQLLVKLEEESQAHQRLKFELYETKGLLEGFRLEKSLKSLVPMREPLARLVENMDEGRMHLEAPQVQNCTDRQQQDSDLQASVCVVEKLESGPAKNATEEKKRGPKARAEKAVDELSSQVITLEATLEEKEKCSEKLVEENETASGGLQKQLHFLESQPKNLHQCAKFRTDERETDQANFQQVVCRHEGPPQGAKGLTRLLNAVSETQLTELEEQLKNGAERWRELVQGKLLAEEALYALQDEFLQLQQEYTKSRQVQQQLQQDFNRQHRAIEDLQQDKESLEEQQCENLLQITGLQARLDKQKQQLLPQEPSQGEQDDQLDQLLRQTRAEMELQSRELESMRTALRQKEIEKLSLSEEGDAMNMHLKEMKEENLKLQDEIDSLRSQSSQTSSNISADILGLPIALLEVKNQEIDLLNEQISVLQEEMKMIRKRGSVTSEAPSVGRPRSVTNEAPSVRRPRSVTSAAPVEWPWSMTSEAPSVGRPRSVTSEAPSVGRPRSVTSEAPSVGRPWSVTSEAPLVERPQSVTSEAPLVERPQSVASTTRSVERMRSVASSSSSLVDHSYSPVPLSEKSNSCASDLSRCLHMEMETAEHLDAKLAEHVHRWLHQQVPNSGTSNDVLAQSEETFPDVALPVPMQEAMQLVQQEGFRLLALSQQPVQISAGLEQMETEKMEAYLQCPSLPEAKDEGSESSFQERNASGVKGSRNTLLQEKSVLLQNTHSVQRQLAIPVHPAAATAKVPAHHELNMADRHSLLEEMGALRSQCRLTELRLQEQLLLLDEEKSHQEHCRHVHEQQMKRQTELNEHKLQQVKDEMQALCRELDDERERRQHTTAQLDEERGNLFVLQTQLDEERRNVAKLRTQLDKVRGVASGFQTKSDEDQYLVHLQTQLDEERQRTASVCTQLNEARCELDRTRLLPRKSSVEHKWRDELEARANEIQKLQDAFRSKEAQTAEMQKEFESKKQEMQRDLENQQKSLQQQQANVEKLRAALQHALEIQHQHPIPTKVQEEYTQVQQKLLNEKARAIQLESLLQKERDRGSEHQHLLQKERGRVTEHQHMLQKEKDRVTEHQHLLQKEKDRVTEHQHLLQKERDRVTEHQHLLQKERDRVTEHQHLLQKEKDRVTEHQHLLQKERGRVTEHQHMLQKEKDIVTEHQHLLQKEKDRVTEHQHLLQKERGRVTEHQHLLQKEKDHASENQDLLQKERDSGVRRLHLLQKERDQIVRLQNLLQNERDQVAELQDLFQKEKKQVADLQYQLFGAQMRVSELKSLLPNESIHCVRPKSQLNMHHSPSCIQQTSVQTDKSNVKDVGTSPCRSPLASKRVNEDPYLLPLEWRMKWSELEVELQRKCKQVQELEKQMEALRIVEPQQDENVPECKSCHVEGKQSAVEKQLYKYHSRYLRAESFRKSLAYQKIYLLLLIGGFEATEKATLALIVRMGGHPKAGVAQPGKINRFRSTVWVIIAIIRLQFLVKNWRVVYRTKRMIRRNVSRSEKPKVNSPLEFPVACDNPCYPLTRSKGKAASSIR
uniref:pericentrin-like n=1 Tax=Myxine glutinosa TaxID=7769 RepID=UPI00358F5B64